MSEEERRERRNKLYEQGQNKVETMMSNLNSDQDATNRFADFAVATDVRLGGAQQSRCPIHDVALAGLCATCPVEGCHWQMEQSRMMAQSAQEPDPRQYQNAAFPPEPISYFEADRNFWREKHGRTQGIRGALANLWRQIKP